MSANVKKTFILLSVIVCLCALLCGAPVAYAQQPDPVIILSAETGETIKLTARLKKNYGIYALNLALSYDSSAFILCGYERGSALGSLDLLTTATDGPFGYGVTPFIFNYFSYTSQNDSSTGDMLVLYFKVKDNAPDGEYYFSFDYNRDTDALRISDNESMPVNPLIDRARVTLASNKVGDVSVISANNDTSGDTSNNKRLAIILGCSLGGCALAGALAAFFVLKNKKKSK